MIFLLNIPWTLVGFLQALVSIPYRVRFDSERFAIIFDVISLWWLDIFHAPNKPKGVASGHVVCIGPRGRGNEKILFHELIHVEQHIRYPFIAPFLYWHEMIRRGYRKNQFEIEAYNRSDTWPEEWRPRV